MKHQTSSLQLCGQQTVLTLTQSTTRFGEAAGACVQQPDSWRRPAEGRAWSKSGNISTRSSPMKLSGSGVPVFELAFDFEHTVDILNTDFRRAEVLPFARTHTWQSITPLPIVDTDAFEWPFTKLAVAVADVDRFCWNLLTCLQFNDAVL